MIEIYCRLSLFRWEDEIEVANLIDESNLKINVHINGCFGFCIQVQGRSNREDTTYKRRLVYTPKMGRKIEFTLQYQDQVDLLKGEWLILYRWSPMRWLMNVGRGRRKQNTYSYVDTNVKRSRNVCAESWRPWMSLGYYDSIKGERVASYQQTKRTQ